MPRGYPDYQSPNTTFANVQFDGSAIVSGLGGAVSIDGRGYSLFVDTFDRGVGSWGLTSAGSGIVPRLSFIQPYVYKPPVSLLLDPVAHAGESSASRSFGVLPHAKIGVETVIFVPADGANPRIGISHWGDNEYQQGYSVQVNRANETIEVLTDSGYETAYDFSSRYELPYGWIYMKLVVDPMYRYYERLIFGNLPIDLSSYQGQEGDQGFIGRTDVFISALGDGDNYGALAVGYFRLTIDEP